MFIDFLYNFQFSIFIRYFFFQHENIEPNDNNQNRGKRKVELVVGVKNAVLGFIFGVILFNDAYLLLFE